MKIVEVKIKLFVIVFCVGLNSNCSSFSEASKENAVFEDKASICQISLAPQLYYEKEMLIEGEVSGFHRLLLYNPDCKAPESAMILDLTAEKRSELLGKAEDLKIDLNGIEEQKGNLNFRGKFRGVLRRVESVDSQSNCYNPDKDEKIFNPTIKMCFEVNSIEELKPL